MLWMLSSAVKNANQTAVLQIPGLIQVSQLLWTGVGGLPAPQGWSDISGQQRQNYCNGQRRQLVWKRFEITTIIKIVSDKMDLNDKLCNRIWQKFPPVTDMSACQCYLIFCSKLYQIGARWVNHLGIPFNIISFLPLLGEHFGDGQQIRQGKSLSFDYRMKPHTL